MRELHLRGISCENQICIHLQYKGLELDNELRLDVHAKNVLCVELKAQEGLLPVHDAILLSYTQMLQKPKGVLINFHCINIFREGQKTLVNKLFAELRDE